MKNDSPSDFDLTMGMLLLIDLMRSQEGKKMFSEMLGTDISELDLSEEDKKAYLNYAEVFATTISKEVVKCVKPVHDLSLEEYCKYAQQQGDTEWSIGWEAIPRRYIGAKIHNTRTGVTATVKWDESLELIDEKGESVKYGAHEFRHGTGEWIYKIGEDYKSNNASA